MKSLFFHVLLVGLVLLSARAGAVPLTLVAEAYPPLIEFHKDVATGPMVNAARQLLAQNGIDAHFVSMPTTRIVGTLPSNLGVCAFAIPFDPGLAETATFVAKVAPISLSVFGVRPDLHTVRNVQDLRGYRVGALDIQEVRDLLDFAGIRYQPVTAGGNGTGMLAAGRFDVWIGDDTTQMATGTPKMRKLFGLARLERWVACEKSTPAKILLAVRTAFKEGVLAASTRPLWRENGLESYFNDARKQFLQKN
ncbi:hypothetical protein VI06_21505 [Aquitalea magnusonii]|nr:hypothetical protein VI06_21505 [Aquitalea magnusonii]